MTQPKALRLAEADEQMAVLMRTEPVYAPTLRSLQSVNESLMEVLQRVLGHSITGPDCVSRPVLEYLPQDLLMLTAITVRVSVESLE